MPVLNSMEFAAAIAAMLLQSSIAHGGDSGDSGVAMVHKGLPLL